MARSAKPKATVADPGRSTTAELDSRPDFSGTQAEELIKGEGLQIESCDEPRPANPPTVPADDDMPLGPQVQQVGTEQVSYGNPALAPAEVLAFIDGVDEQGRLKGWACVKDQPAQRVEVEIYDGVELLGFGIADHYRQDLSDAGLSDGASGFEVQLARTALDGLRRTLVIRCEATQARPLVVKYELGVAAEPTIPQNPAVATTNGHLARIKALSQTGVAGPPAQASLYVAGQRILTRAPYPAPPYHVSGWHDPENDFTWISGYEATIEMYVRSPRQSYTFSIEVVPNGVSKQAQTLEIFFNRQRLGFAEVAHRMTVSVEVPREVFTSRISLINLHCRNAVIGTEFGSSDNRRLGIAVVSWQLA